MPTLATGNKPRWGSPGFTLLELMLVLAVFAMSSAIVVWRLAQSAERELREDAEYLATQLQVTRHRALAEGQPYLWQATPLGYKVQASSNSDNHTVSITNWRSPHTQAATTSLTLPAEPVAPTLLVELRSSALPQWRAWVEAHGLAPFKVRMETPSP